MISVEVLETDFGTFPVPSEIRDILRRCKFRKDRQPDRRTKAGKEWSAAFLAFTEGKKREYLAA